MILLYVGNYLYIKTTNMSSVHMSPLHVESLPYELAPELGKIPYIPIPEFEEHTIRILSGQTLRYLFSAHLNARNHACGTLMGMLALPESKRDPALWFQALGILQREDQYMRTIAEYYNRAHAK